MIVYFKQDNVKHILNISDKYWEFLNTDYM